jgi:hypothetical protein
LGREKNRPRHHLGAEYGNIDEGRLPVFDNGIQRLENLKATGAAQVVRPAGRPRRELGGPLTFQERGAIGGSFEKAGLPDLRFNNLRPTSPQAVGRDLPRQ